MKLKVSKEFVPIKIQITLETLSDAYEAIDELKLISSDYDTPSFLQKLLDAIEVKKNVSKKQ